MMPGAMQPRPRYLGTMPPSTTLLRTSRTAVIVLALARAADAQTVNWPVYGGSDDHTHFTTLSQISPANVRTLKVAWTYDTHDAFAGSEMQSNPIVVDGVLYATTPKLQVFALDAATGLATGWNPAVNANVIFALAVGGGTVYVGGEIASTIELIPSFSSSYRGTLSAIS